MPRAETRPSQQATLPGPHIVPRRLVESVDLEWFDTDDVGRNLALLADGTRNIKELAALMGIAIGEAQLRIADLRERTIVTFD